MMNAPPAANNSNRAGLSDNGSAGTTYVCRNAINMKAAAAMIHEAASVCGDAALSLGRAP